jgi:choline dehydrogenase-like flavoprotein
MALAHVNAVIVGAGAAGGVVAKELATNGLTVVLIERGTWHHFDDHDHDELISQRVTVLGNAFGPDDQRHKRMVKFGDEWRTVLPSEPGYSNNAACVGGGTYSYGGQAWRFMEQDFRMKSTYGRPEGSTLDDWPISYQDLEPYYEKAEWEIGVSGDQTDPHAAPRRRAYPMPPFAYNLEARMLEVSAKKLGFHLFPIPMLRNSVPRDGRGGHPLPLAASASACECTRSADPQHRHSCRDGHRHCDVRTEASSGRLTTDARGRATGVTYFDPQGRLQTQTADLTYRVGVGHRVGAPAAQLQAAAVPQRPRQSPRLGRPQPPGARLPGAWGLFDQDVYDDVGRGRRSPSATSTMGTTGCAAADARQRAHPPAVPALAHASGWRAALGPRPQAVPAAALPPQHDGDRSCAGDACLRVARGGRSVGDRR